MSDVSGMQEAHKGGIRQDGRYVNWSGSVQFRPAKSFSPETEEELSQIIRRAREGGKTVRPVGSGHSCTDLFATDGYLVFLDRFQGILEHDPEMREVTVGAGTPLVDLGHLLHERGLEFVNLGDAAIQTISGAIGTGTHGTGRKLPIVSMMLVGGTLVNGKGEVVEFSEEDPELLSALRVSLGVLGVLTRMRLRLQPSYPLERTEWCTSVEALLDHFEELDRQNHIFDFYWYPRSDDIKIRLLNPPGGNPASLRYAKKLEMVGGPAYSILPKHTFLPNRWEEIEYLLDRTAWRPAFLEMRKRINKHWRKTVGWRVLMRTITADDAWLSPAYRRDSVALNPHQNAELEWKEFFREMEAIYLDHGGRPHWGKKHWLKADRLKPMYAKWDDFMAKRKELDPDGVLLNPYLRELLGEAA